AKKAHQQADKMREAAIKAGDKAAEQYWTEIYNIMKALEAALKVQANATYGFTCANGGTGQCNAIGGGITCSGRCGLLRIQTESLKVLKVPSVYGDTDSLFIFMLHEVFGDKTTQELWDIAQKFADAMTTLFWPMKLELEK